MAGSALRFIGGLFDMGKFNEKEYLSLHLDVAEAVKAGVFKNGYEHYVRHGKAEGRAASLADNLSPRKKVLSPREKAVFHLVNKTGLGLEIGPSHNPMAPKRAGYKVHILDHATADELRAKYQEHGLNLDNIEEVDFVWKGEPLSDLIGQTKCYDWIIASHVIEHVPDLISFLQQCEALLKPGGVLSLVVPDKRYCFDFFQPPSTTGAVLDAFQEKRTRPSAGQVFNHFANAASRTNAISWSDDDRGGADGLVHTFENAKQQWNCRIETEDYIDVHCWRFTPESFALMLSDINRLGLVGLGIQAQFPTSGCEFYVSLGLTKQPSTEKIDRIELLETIN